MEAIFDAVAVGDFVLRGGKDQAMTKPSDGSGHVDHIPDAEDSQKKWLVKPRSLYRPRLVCYRGFLSAFSRFCPVRPHRLDFSLYRDRFPWFYAVDRRRPGKVIIAKRDIGEEVPHSSNTEFFQMLGHDRTNSGYIADRCCWGKLHGLIILKQLRFVPV